MSIYLVRKYKIISEYFLHMNLISNSIHTVNLRLVANSGKILVNQIVLRIDKMTERK